METDLRIRAFRATDDFDTCMQFYEGHRKVLENHGIFKVTSSGADWLQSRSAFVIVIETMDGSKLYGGARIHAADGVMQLPIEQATAKLDPAILQYVRTCSEEGTGEICGLWNSVEVAGLGIGSLFPARVAVVIAEQIGLSTLFSLCSPPTIRFTQWLGSRVFHEVGNNGTFYYPKLDLLATAAFLEDVTEISRAHPRERQKMLYLREHPNEIILEASPFKKNITVNIHYELEIKGLVENEFKTRHYNKAL